MAKATLVMCGVALAFCTHPLAWATVLGDFSSTSVDVTTRSLGRVEGLRLETLLGAADVFRGIRYALAKRFELSVPYTSNHSHSSYDATKFGARCYQPSFPMQPAPGAIYSEDCLFINIWRPARGPISSNASRLPIMFWIHGGGFTQGSGEDPLTDGVHFALSQGVIVVTINYRLGPLGFLVKDASGAGGMNGLGDAVLALHWVRDNIEAFHGDAGRVTVFGESAGGCAACVLAISTASRGLFHHAIVESGPCVGSWGPESSAAGIIQRDALMARHGRSSVEGLLSVPPENLTWTSSTQGYFIDDGTILGEPSLHVFSRGGVHVRTLAIGGNSDDDLPALLPAPLFPKKDANITEYLLALSLKWGLHSRAVEKQYPLDRFHGNARAAFSQASSDYTVTCPSLSIARHTANATSKSHQTRVFLYRFAHLQHQCDAATWLQGVVPSGDSDWASHGAEIPFVWNNTHFNNPLNGTPIECRFTSQERKMSSSIMSLWSSIAKTGIPADSSGTEEPIDWPPFTAESGEITLRMSLPQSKPIRNLKAADCAFWESLTVAEDPIVV